MLKSRCTGSAEPKAVCCLPQYPLFLLDIVLFAVRLAAFALALLFLVERFLRGTIL
jgi:hypothetical protein